MTELFSRLAALSEKREQSARRRLVEAHQAVAEATEGLERARQREADERAKMAAQREATRRRFVGCERSRIEVENLLNSLAETREVESQASAQATAAQEALGAAEAALEEARQKLRLAEKTTAKRRESAHRIAKADARAKELKIEMDVVEAFVGVGRTDV